MKLFIERPVLTILIMIAIALAGISSLLKLPMSDLPSIDSPVVTIYATYPGANPQTVLDNLTTPLEKALQSIPGATSIASNSHQGGTTLTLEFDFHEDMDKAEQRIEKAVYQAESRMPAEMSHAPIISRQNSDSGRVLTIILHSKTLATNDLIKYAERKIKPLLNRITGVASVDIWGQSNNIEIAVDPHLLRAYNIPLEDVINKLNTLKGNNPLGSIKTGIKNLKLELQKPDLTLKSLRNLEIASGPIALKKVANVDFSKANSATIRYINKNVANDSVVISVQKQSGANTVAISKQIRTMLPQLNKELPKAIELEVFLDRASWIENSLWDVELSMIIAIFLVALVVYVTLGRFRETLIPTIALILSILATFIVMKWLGFKLDLLSLLALTLAVGFVVDDAIVVMENILRQREKGLSAFDASLKGAREILFTVISITVSLVAVFIPLLFMGGMNELLFREFSLTLIIGIVISGILSITVTPMLSRYLIKAHKGEKTRGALDSLIPLYKRSLEKAMDYPYTIASTGVIALVLTFVLGNSLEINLFPSEDRGIMQGYIQYPEGISGDESNKLHKELEATIMPLEGTDSFIIVNYPNMSLFSLKSTIPIKAMISNVEKALTTIPGIKANLQPLQLIEKIAQGPGGGALQYELKGFDFPELHDSAIALDLLLENHPHFKSIRKSFNPHNPTLLIRINEDQAHPMGVSPKNVEKIVQQLFSGSSLGTFKVEGADYEIHMALKLPYKNRIDALGLLTISNSEGSAVPLNTFITWEEKLSADAYRQKDLLPSVRFNFEVVEGTSIADGLEELQELAETVMPDGVSGEFTGLAKLSTEAKKNTLILMLMAILVMYFVLGMLYESFIHPLTILSSIPLAAFGGVITLLFFGEPLSLFTIVGFLLLIGIIKKNGIMMIDFALVKRREGYSSKDSIVDACATRFRPIMMTTFAAMMGALPIALGIGEGADTRQGLGWVIFGGLAISQVLTLYVTPAFYILFDRRQSGAS